MKEDGKIEYVAVKVLDLEQCTDIFDVYQEVAVMSKWNHPNILKNYAQFQVEQLYVNDDASIDTPSITSSNEAKEHFQNMESPLSANKSNKDPQVISALSSSSPIALSPKKSESSCATPVQQNDLSRHSDSFEENESIS